MNPENRFIETDELTNSTKASHAWEEKGIASKIADRVVVLPDGVVGIPQSVGAAIQALIGRIDLLEAQVTVLSEDVSRNTSVDQEIYVSREVDDGAALAEIKLFFKKHDGETFYPDEVAEALNLDIDQAIQLCAILATEGQIAEPSKTEND